MVIYSYFWTAASFFVHITSMLSRELFMCTNSSDFLFPTWKGKRLFGSKLLVFHFRRKRGRELSVVPSGAGAAGCGCLLPAGGREACPALLVLAHPSYIKHYINYIL